MLIVLDDQQRAMLTEVLSAAPLQGSHTLLVLRTLIALRGHDPAAIAADIDRMLATDYACDNVGPKE